MRKIFTTGKILGGVVLLIIIVLIAVARTRSSTAERVDVGAAATRDVFRSYITASGEIVATRFADVGSSVMGRVVALTVREGDRAPAVHGDAAGADHGGGRHRVEGSTVDGG